jgi:large subunit ribosomal protein L29
MAKNEITLSAMSADQLQTELATLRAAYSENKFQHAVQGMANPMELREQRRNIARYMTELRGREVAVMTPDQLAMRSKLRNRRKRGA